MTILILFISVTYYQKLVLKHSLVVNKQYIWGCKSVASQCSNSSRPWKQNRRFKIKITNLVNMAIKAKIAINCTTQINSNGYRTNIHLIYQDNTKVLDFLFEQSNSRTFVVFTLFEKFFLEVLRMRATINKKIWVKRKFCAGIIQLVLILKVVRATSKLWSK